MLKAILSDFMTFDRLRYLFEQLHVFDLIFEKSFFLLFLLGNIKVLDLTPSLVICLIFQNDEIFLLLNPRILFRIMIGRLIFGARPRHTTADM